MQALTARWALPIIAILAVAAVVAVAALLLTQTALGGTAWGFPCC